MEELNQILQDDGWELDESEAYWVCGELKLPASLATGIFDRDGEAGVRGLVRLARVSPEWQKAWN